MENSTNKERIMVIGTREIGMRKFHEAMLECSKEYDPKEILAMAVQSGTISLKDYMQYLIHIM